MLYGRFAITMSYHKKVNAVAVLDGEFWAVEDASPYNLAIIRQRTANGRPYIIAI